MFHISIFISYLALVSLFSISKCDLVKESSNNGFTIHLIHRDSPESLLYDHTISPSKYLINSLKQSIYRAQHLTSKIKSAPESDLISVRGEYIIKYFTGTPPVPTLSIADTGSDIVWTQCSPCLECINQTLPLFSPRNSTSYKRVACNTTVCNSLKDFTNCSPTRHNCLYHMGYGDGSYTSGTLATENFMFATADKKQVTIPNVLFGCGFKNGGIFSGIESGIFGLGGGKASFITQEGSLTQGKFSYCLVPFAAFMNSSKLHFGENAKVSGSGVVSTPLFVRKGSETYYFLTMLGFTIGDERINMDNVSHPSMAAHQEGNIIIDSGTTLAFLPFYFYKKVVAAISKRVKLQKTNDPQGNLELCYSTRRDDGKGFPEITVHLKGADLKWGFENGFLRVSETVVCFAATDSAPEGFGIYGNLAQVNFLVGYDVRKRSLSFKPLDCLRS